MSMSDFAVSSFRAMSFYWRHTKFTRIVPVMQKMKKNCVIQLCGLHGFEAHRRLLTRLASLQMKMAIG